MVLRSEEYIFFKDSFNIISTNRINTSFVSELRSFKTFSLIKRGHNDHEEILPLKFTQHVTFEGRDLRLGSNQVDKPRFSFDHRS